MCISNKEFLIGWLLEFGCRPVGCERTGSGWYRNVVQTRGMSIYSVRIETYFNYIGSSAQLNQAGLDFIKERKAK